MYVSKYWSTSTGRIVVHKKKNASLYNQYVICYIQNLK